MLAQQLESQQAAAAAPVPKADKTAELQVGRGPPLVLAARHTALRCPQAANEQLSATVEVCVRRAPGKRVSHAARQTLKARLEDASKAAAAVRARCLSLAATAGD